MSARLSERWIRAALSMSEVPLRIGYLRSEILRVGAGEAAIALDDLCGRAEQADPRARDVLASAVPLFTEAVLSGLMEELRGIAREKALLPLGRLLRGRGKRRTERSGRRSPPLDAPEVGLSADPTEPRGPGPAARKVSASIKGRTLTLGERKALARRLRGGAMLDKLLADPHPDVIRLVLSNPRITEDDVVRLAARRPVYSDVITEIARSPSWTQRPRVRMAILQNPGSPPEVTVPMVRLLIRPELRELLAATDIPAAVRVAARELIERRPPMPERRGSGGTTQ